MSLQLPLQHLLVLLSRITFSEPLYLLLLFALLRLVVTFVDVDNEVSASD